METKSRRYNIGKKLGVFIGFFLLGCIVGFFCLIPFLFIWTVNTLFLLGIPYSLETYTASLFLFFFVKCCGVAQLFALKRIGRKKCCGGCG